MAEENIQQSQAPVENQPKAPAPEAPPTPTLDDIAKKYNVVEQAQAFTQQTSPATQQTQPQFQPQFQPPYQAPAVPDPVLDPQGFARFQEAMIRQNSESFTNSVKSLEAKLAQFEQERKQTKIDADVNKAVERVNEAIKADPMYVEAALEARYRRDPVFKRIWDNREMNPKALEEALQVVTNDLRNVFQVRQDNQLAENIRAARASTQTMANAPAKDDAQTRSMKMDDRAFDAFWEELKRTGGIVQ